MIHEKSGNIFVILFGAVALVGVLAVTSMQAITGPIFTATRATQKNMIETHLLTNARLVIMNASTLPAGGDSDEDGTIEPIEYVPHGSHGCAIGLIGGGCLPSSLGAALTDPYGSPYGYCVWDHGAVNNGHADGSPAAPYRLRGGTDAALPVIALISAGPDKIFQTTCHAFDGAGQGGPAKPVGSDDFLFSYTYNEALASSGGLWIVKPADPQTAEISKDLEVKDAGGNVTVSMDRTTGIGAFLGITTDLITPKTGDSLAIADGSLSIYSPRDEVLRLEKKDGSDWSYIRFGKDNSDTWASGVNDSGNYFVGSYTPNFLSHFTVDRASGRVGIGTENAQARLHVREISNNVGTHFLSYNNYVVDPLSSNTAVHYGTYTLVQSLATNPFNTTGLRAAYNYAQHDAPGTLSDAHGAMNYAYNTGNGSIANAYGARNTARNTGAGSIANIYGAYNYGLNLNPGTATNIFGAYNYAHNNAASGTISNLRAAYNQARNSGAADITNAYANQSSVYNSGSGTIANAYSFFASLTNNGGGTVNNYYAYYATDEASTATNSYAFYANGTARSYFGGNIGIGATDPDARLTISASDKVSNQIMLRSHRAGIASGDVIGGIEFMSNDTNLAAPGVSVGAVKAVAEATHTAGNLTTGLSISVTNSLATSEAVRIAGSGNVGIGVSAPVARLDVDGYARLRTYSAIPDTCNASREGAIAYSGQKYLCFCDGSSWKQAHSPASVCNW